MPQRKALAASVLSLLFCFVSLLGTRSSHADSVVVFNEVMYHPFENELNLEWIELHNQMAVDVDLSGWFISDGVFFQFPEGTIVEGGDYIVVASNPAALAAETGFDDAFGPFTGRLSNSGERLEIRDHNGRDMDRFTYGVGGDWPVEADGAGVSIAKIDPDTRSSQEDKWTRSAEIGGTPGRVNFTDGGAPPQTQAEGLVAYWSFDEASGQALDSAGGNHGNLGSGVDRVAGIVGEGAVTFDNTTSALVNVGAGVDNAFETSSGITVEAIIVPEWSGAANDYDEIFRKEDGSRRILLAFQHDGNSSSRDVAITPETQATLSFGINVDGIYSELDMPLDGNAGRPSLADLKDGSPHHVAATYRAATGHKTIYVDGVSVFSTNLGVGSEIDSGGIATAYIGNMSGRREPFTGLIDEVAFWDRALSSADIASHWAAVGRGENYFVEDGGPVDSSGVRIAFNETEIPAAGAGRVELLNLGGSVSLEGFTLESQGTIVGQYTFPNVTLGPGEFHTLTTTELGFDFAEGNRLFLFAPNHSAVIEGRRLRLGARGRSPDGTGDWFTPDRTTFGSANSFAFHDEIVINEIFYHPKEEPVVNEGGSQPVGDVILPIDASWRYDASGDDLGTSWKNNGFNDGGWDEGDALIYRESGGLPAPKNTEIELGATTFYFRTNFDFAGDVAKTQLFLRTVIDDGAVFYLNGSEIFRLRMPDGAVDSDTLARGAVGDAVFEGPFDVPTTALRQGTNLIAVEVHQRTTGSSDMVFGTEVSVVTTEPGEEPETSESPEAWVELFNKSDDPVSLDGWAFVDGIRFAFPDGTTIGAGEFLVVARDVEFFESLHPGVDVVGPFEGRLGRRTDKLVLEDENGNLADVVEYYDGRPWPSAPDGGGSSLELRDADADNNRPGAWAASDEFGKTEWKTYTFRLNGVRHVGPSQWREFVFGMLDDGEILLDDLSVIEDPDGARRQFVSNGDFESGESGWRLLGNHRLSEVIDDPDEPGNRVLRIVSTGPTEHMHNHIERTNLGNLAPTSGRVYEFSFRARWVSGSHQLHTRIYFNFSPMTTLIDRPETSGTPGAPNSMLESNIGPTMIGLAHTPVAPNSGEAVTVSIDASDPDDVAEARVWYSVEGGTWRNVSMSRSADGLFRGTIPGQSGSRTVQFYIEATDGAGATETWPRAGRDSRACYRTNDGQARLGTVHNVRIIMPPRDINILYETIRRMSNHQMPCTIVYNEKEVFYGASVRLRGSERGRPTDNRVSFNIRFPANHRFRGVHKSIGCDRSGGWSGFVPQQSQDEILVKHVANYAGGIPAMYDDMCRVIAPRTQHTSYALLLMARYNDVFLDSMYENGSDGQVFKYDLIYHPTTANAQGYKNPQPDGVLGSDLRDLGNDKEAYRWLWNIRNNRSQDDYSGMIRACQAFSASGASLEAAADAALDVDEWMRVFAVYSLTGIGDTYTFGNNHNNMHYVRPSDGKVLVMMWDADFAFVRGTNASLYGDQGLRRIIQIPGNERRFHAHLKDIIDRIYNTNYMRHWTDHYGSISGKNFGGILNYIGQRASFVRSRLPGPVTFRITTNGGAPMTVDTQTVTLEGDAGIDVHSILVEGLEAAPQISWPTRTRWRMTVPLSGGENIISLLGLSPIGEISATDSIRVTTTFNLSPPTLTSVDPSEAPPGEILTVRGEGFERGIDFFFDDVPAASVTFDPAVDSSLALVEVPDLPMGDVQLTATNFGSDPSNALTFTVGELPPRFIRGDFNLDSSIDVSDAVRILRHLFGGLEAFCRDAGDVDNNEILDLTDAVRLLSFLFQQGAPPSAPYPNPGEDEDMGEGLDCEMGI